MANSTKSNIDIVDVSSVSSWALSKKKRLIDLAVASILMIAIMPVFLPALIFNVLATRGHPIFVQPRARGREQEFRLLKLRTMRSRRGGESWSHRTQLHDSRLTLIGKILRQTYIDELPQLINVLRGEMSLIGPRPETLETTREISNSNPRFYRRMDVKPGITGAAQIFFRKPESDFDLWRRYYYDRLYIANCSFRFDMYIIFLTVWHVLRNKGH